MRQLFNAKLKHKFKLWAIGIVFFQFHKCINAVDLARKPALACVVILELISTSKRGLGLKKLLD